MVWGSERWNELLEEILKIHVASCIYHLCVPERAQGDQTIRVIRSVKVIKKQKVKRPDK